MKTPYTSIIPLPEYPLLVPLFGLAMGIWCADVLSVTIPARTLTTLLFCLVLSCLIRNNWPCRICTTLFFVCCGISLMTPWSNHFTTHPVIDSAAAKSTVIAEGIIDSRPSLGYPDSTRFLLTLEHLDRGQGMEPVTGTIQIRVAQGRLSDLQRGDRIRCRIHLTIPDRPDLPGAMDYGRYLRHRGIVATGRVADSRHLVLMRGAAVDSALHPVDTIARHLREYIRRELPDIDRSSVVTALILGDQRDIPPELTKAYTLAGVNHILSISGFHLGIIALAVMFLTTKLCSRWEWLLLRIPVRIPALVVTLPLVAAYTLLVGAEPATVRSLIMLAWVGLSLLVERETDPINPLLTAALVLLVLHPPALFDISFQFSFLALWGILLTTPPLTKWVNSITGFRWLLRSLLLMIAASVAATAATALPALHYFGQASATGIIANLIMVPLLGYGAMLTGFCALPLVWLFPPGASLLLSIAGHLTNWSNRLIELFSHVPVLRIGTITGFDLLASVAVLVILTLATGWRRRVVMTGGVIIMTLAIHLVDMRKRNDGKLHITMLSVGQGESLLVRLPDNRTLLVDGGGYLYDTERDFGELVLGPALSALGVRRIDYLLLTHSHPDHIGGLPHVAATFPVGTFGEADPGGAGEEYLMLSHTLDSRNVPRRLLTAGDRLELGEDCFLTVLSPSREQILYHDDSPVEDGEMNDHSLVFRLEYGSFSMLFTGDSGEETEHRLLSSTALQPVTILKVGHHGSRHATTEKFLSRITPQAALVSAGRRNTFGLPAPETLHRLTRAGVQVFRTDQQGTVTITTDGTTWTAATPYASGHRRLY